SATRALGFCQGDIVRDRRIRGKHEGERERLARRERGVQGAAVRALSLGAALGLALAAEAAVAQTPDLTPGGVVESVRDFDFIPFRPDVDLAVPAAPQDTQAPGELQGDQGPAIAVTSLRVEGNTVFDDAELLAMLGPVSAHPHTLMQLDALAARIVAHYRAAGYAMAQAYIPEQ